MSFTKYYIIRKITRKSHISKKPNISMEKSNYTEESTSLLETKIISFTLMKPLLFAAKIFLTPEIRNRDLYTNIVIFRD